jgi:hypothetical protein
MIMSASLTPNAHICSHCSPSRAIRIQEIYPPSVDEFVDITDNTYTKAEMFRLEGT